MEEKLRTVLASWPYPQTNNTNLFGDYDRLCSLSVRLGNSQISLQKINFKFNTKYGYIEVITQEQFDVIARDIFDSTAEFTRSE